ncbi:hypothetical protein CAPTEDRAFT_217393 [Capitella teleta]|uniref:NACHT domain-containing protein n=1 Tax=Capitella teleta TaxID=283909 RepID=R7UEC4_CAPTE|nr:hypothetical protein CAPTEDRAFT_217393 [Capitella teleta]|eukprot:ELU04889.1 hypothetical protein CAPTEDRAFT_217393 [Capitella teleta]
MSELLQDQLKSLYKQRLESINPVPWLPQHRFCLEDVYVRLNLLPFEALLSPQSLPSSGQEVSQKELFAPHEFSRDLKRLLVEGRPGMGKSTLCRMLPLKWSNDCPGQEECGHPCVHSFDLLFFLHASDFIGKTSIPDLVTSQLLADDSDISPEQLEVLLKGQACKFLFIADAYDEAHEGNQLFNDLIEANLQLNATVLVSSRPMYLSQRLSSFNSVFEVFGFDEGQQAEYVERLAQQMRMDSNQLEMLRRKMKDELRDLCRNPLIITILGLLCTERNPSLPSTMTGIYEDIHSFILEKTSKRLNCTDQGVIMDLIQPLAKCAFESYLIDRYALIERDLEACQCRAEDILQTGYVVMETCIGPHSTAPRYSFSHKTFQEFLAALHLQKMAPEARLEWLKGATVALNETSQVLLFLH